MGASEASHSTHSRSAGRVRASDALLRTLLRHGMPVTEQIHLGDVTPIGRVLTLRGSISFSPGPDPLLCTYLAGRDPDMLEVMDSMENQPSTLRTQLQHLARFGAPHAPEPVICIAAVSGCTRFGAQPLFWTGGCHI